MKSNLLERYDQDAGPWRPMYYSLNLDVPVIANQSVEGSITLNNQPYIWQSLGHQILGNTGDPETSGLYQDSQYLIEFKDEQSNYQAAPIAAGAAFGNVQAGFQNQFPFPVPFAGTKTITFRASSTYTRVLTPTADTFRLQLVMAGVADWGVLLG